MKGLKRSMVTNCVQQSQLKGITGARLGEALRRIEAVRPISMQP